ncbi:MAG: hypothetical protein FWC46_05635 [Actinomycetia bacterium]|nr:hypothetical protein [Actinomycetes bacterium]
MDRFLRIFGGIVVAIIALRVVGWVLSSLMWLFWVGLIVAAVVIPIAYISRRAIGPGGGAAS